METINKTMNIICHFNRLKRKNCKIIKQMRKNIGRIQQWCMRCFNKLGIEDNYFRAGRGGSRL